MTFKQKNILASAAVVIAFGSIPTEWKFWGWWTLLAWPLTLIAAMLINILLGLMMDFWSDELERKEDEVSSEWQGAAAMVAFMASIAFQTPFGPLMWENLGPWSLIFVALGILVGTLPSTGSSSSGEKGSTSTSPWVPAAIGTYLILRHQQNEQRKREQKEALEKIHRVWHPND